MIVVDASVVLELLLGGEVADEVAEAVARNRHEIAAPHLLDVEVGGVLRRYRREGRLEDQRLSDALDDLADLPVARYGHLPLLRRAVGLRAVTTGDALYLALAASLGAELVTADPALGEVEGTSARVRVLGTGR